MANKFKAATAPTAKASAPSEAASAATILGAALNAEQAGDKTQFPEGTHVFVITTPVEPCEGNPLLPNAGSGLQFGLRIESSDDPSAVGFEKPYCSFKHGTPNTHDARRLNAIIRMTYGVERGNAKGLGRAAELFMTDDLVGRKYQATVRHGVSKEGRTYADQVDFREAE